MFMMVLSTSAPMSSHPPPHFPPVFPPFSPVFLTFGDKRGFGAGDHGPLHFMAGRPWQILFRCTQQTMAMVVESFSSVCSDVDISVYSMLFEEYASAADADDDDIVEPPDAVSLNSEALQMCNASRKSKAIDEDFSVMPSTPSSSKHSFASFGAVEDERLADRDDLMCAICLSYVCSPRTLDCGHTFCCRCLLAATVSSPSYTLCPLCRATLMSMDVESIPVDTCKEHQVHLCALSNPPPQYRGGEIFGWR